MAKVAKYHQSIKIRFSTQNMKISAVSTPIFARISRFFCIFRDLPEYIAENASKCQKMQKSFAPNFGNFQKICKNGHILILWLCFILWYFAGCLHFHFEICENLQPEADSASPLAEVRPHGGVTLRAAPSRGGKPRSAQLCILLHLS